MNEFHPPAPFTQCRSNSMPRHRPRGALHGLASHSPSNTFHNVEKLHENAKSILKSIDDILLVDTPY
jgi:hypothetical protein